METSKICQRIESLELSTELGVISGADHFKMAVLEHPVMLVAQEEMDAGNLPVLEVKARLHRLLSHKIDQRYRHTHDIAIAVYILLLKTVCPNCIKGIARGLLANDYNLHWGRIAAYSALQS